MPELSNAESAVSRATARCTVTMAAETRTKIAGQELAKGDVLGIARIAAIQGAKRTSELVPSVQNSLLGAITVDFELGDTSIEIVARVVSRDQGSVEMESLTACMVAALTIYDMCKAVDRSMSIGPIELVER
ncbi:MAG TPA: cyclic pyranopterin monophosphate synthase MoaC [Acidimicrobiales bacterium]|nr:cyclic pyranopterin monophosphate synthase MoaC [Acidimicrobiales bacterium]